MLPRKYSLAAKLMIVHRSCSRRDTQIFEQRYHSAACRVVDLASDRLRTFSGTSLQITTVKLPYQKELVTLALMQPLAAVGSANHVTFVDMRCGHVAHSVESLDEGWGTCPPLGIRTQSLFLLELVHTITLDT